MTQKTNLNISPYYDDFDENNNFYRVLFKPGFPIQSRELTTLQSILQNQIKNFGSHIFKEGSVVIPGSISYDNTYYSVKVQDQNLGVDVSVYASFLVGNKITGKESKIKAIVTNYLLISESEGINNLTLFVKYLDSGISNQYSKFIDGEELTVDEDLIYGNTTIVANSTVCRLITADACFTGSSVSIQEGIYFIRGTFVNVNSDNIILDAYFNGPSYRVGLSIFEEIVSAKDDKSLYDNARGFSNFAAPGADRLKIYTKLSKKLTSDFEDKNFVELLRIENGIIKVVENKTEYSILRDYFAKRTFEESGNYTVEPFKLNFVNSLNDRLSNDGLYYEYQSTDSGREPSKNLLSLKISPGRAYVRGYDVDKQTTTFIDVPKPRDGQTVSSAKVPFSMGTYFRVNNVKGIPYIGVDNNTNILELYNRRSSSLSSGTGDLIGKCRMYSFQLSDSEYDGDNAEWDLNLFDIQTYTKITVNQSLSSDLCPTTSFVRGINSGAFGYVVSVSGTEITLSQTSGSFIDGEQITINETTDLIRSIRDIKSYNISDIKSIYQDTSTIYSSLGFKVDFVADTVLSTSILPSFSVSDQLTISSAGIATCPGKNFIGIRSDTIIRYRNPVNNLETFNRVTRVSSDGFVLELSTVPNVTGVCTGTLPSSTLTVPFSLGVPKTKDNENSGLYSPLVDSNIYSIDLTNSSLSIKKQFTQLSTDGVGTLSVNLTSSGISSGFFAPYSVDKYAISYSDSSFEPLTRDQITFSSNNTIITINGLKNNQSSNVILDSTIVLSNIKNKSKFYSRSKTLIVDKTHSGISTSISGLTTSQFYGLRVEDKDISLNVPDVANLIKIYESLDTQNPILDKLLFTSDLALNLNAIKGEKIIGSVSNAVAQIVSILSPAEVEIVYLNDNKFATGERVTFEESNIVTPIQNVTNGLYRDITDRYVLDGGQKNQYYDYSRIVRKINSLVPFRKLMVIFDHYTVPLSDSGYFYTVNSYDEKYYENRIPILPDEKRLCDVLDFRPRVKEFISTTQSPFAFESRTFGDSGNNPTLVIKPGELTTIGYSNYLPRIDKLSLNKFGKFIYTLGISAPIPKEPFKYVETLDIATISMPAYLYKSSDLKIKLLDNKRYSMNDIGKLEDRIENLEVLTSLSLLELDTKTLQIQDAEGLSRFKSGFYVDDFKTNSQRNYRDVDSRFDIDPESKEMTTRLDFASFKPELALRSDIYPDTADFTANLDLYDSNVRKTGDLITLNYTEVAWIESVFATRTENVNPFNIVDWRGSVDLNPLSDNWVRTVYVQGGTRELTGDSDSSYVEELKVSTDTDMYIRSRNVAFTAGGLKPLTRYYVFFDGSNNIDIIPKGIEISMISGAFSIGETVEGFDGDQKVISFRCAQPNHKQGPFDSPTSTFNASPYDRNVSIPSAYSSSSTILNVDTNSLSEESLTRFGGYISVGTLLVGKTSGSQATVSDIKLVTDTFGDIAGCIFFRNPLTTPPPQVRFTTGTKTFKVTSSPTNEQGLTGSLFVSSGETTYRTTSTVDTIQQTTVITRRPPPPPPYYPPPYYEPYYAPEPYYEPFYPPYVEPYYPPPYVEPFYPPPYYEPYVEPYYAPEPEPEPQRHGGKDPLAQTFTVDETGAFLSSVDLFFATKDETQRMFVDVREVELGTPTTRIIQDYARVALLPQDIETSNDASVPTRVTFPSPVYLEANKEYALVLTAPSSDKFTVWIGRMGEKTVNTQFLPDVESVVMSKQYIGGGLFKSQNGSIWTPSQFEDMKFKLYKCNFTSTTGSVFFFNPEVGVNDINFNKLIDNAIRTIPRKLNVGIQSSTSLNSILVPGVKVSEGSLSGPTGIIESVGGKVSSSGITTISVGYGYSSGIFNSVRLYPIMGQGSDITATVSFSSGGRVNSVIVTEGGQGHTIGNMLGITTSDVVKGTGAKLSVKSVDNIDTLFLTNVIGQEFTSGEGLVVYNRESRGSTMTTTIVSSIVADNLYDGSVFEVIDYNHGMHGTNNIVRLANIKPDSIPTSLISNINSDSITISVANTEVFSTFDGITTTRGYALVNNEIIYYNDVGSGTLGIGTRGIDDSVIRNHSSGNLIYKYELNGVSLHRINKLHDMSNSYDLNYLKDTDRYYLRIDRTDRSTGDDQINFFSEKSCGGNNCSASANIQFDAINPQIPTITPGSTSKIQSEIRTVSGTSVGSDGTQVSFIDYGYEKVQINKVNKLSSTRLICSDENENEFLQDVYKNKSFTLKMTLQTGDRNLSPVVDLQGSAIVLRRNRLNNPVSDYSSDGRIKKIGFDPHAASYVSNQINLKQPSTSLKVFLTAYRDETADFRVLYKTFKPDSSEIDQSYQLFPGYDNLIDTNGDGIGDSIINPTNNNGRPDVFVRPSGIDEFLEYQYTVDNLDPFTGFIIKIVMSGTNDARPPRFKDLRVISLA
jgi:hypothetical protein